MTGNVAEVIKLDEDGYNEIIVDEHTAKWANVALERMLAVRGALGEGGPGS